MATAIIPPPRKTLIRVALVGIGNCASSLVQGVMYYTHHPDADGLIHQDIDGYTAADVQFVAAFDVDCRKVGTDLSDAIFNEPNCTAKFSDVPHLNVQVEKGPVLDGVAAHMNESFVVDEAQPISDVIEILKESRAEILICYLPVGSSKAARFYARAALAANVSFINAMPEFICSDALWIKRFEKRGLLCAGDDIKSQVGATILHRVIARLVQDRGHTIDSTYQLNIGGNTDFLNMQEERRLKSKRISKTQAVLSVLDDSGNIQVRIGPSDYVPQLKDNKICFINLKGKQFGGVPFEIDIKLSVIDSPNSAGVVMDVIRLVRVARDRGQKGNIIPVSAYYFKSPPRQIQDDIAYAEVSRYIAEQPSSSNDRTPKI
jgi:myo-inositol-1-phosphate synthase